MLAKQDVRGATGLVFQFIPPATVEGIKETMIKTANSFGVKDLAFAIVTFLPDGESSVVYKVVGNGDENLAVYDKRTHLSIVQDQVLKAVRRWHHSSKLPVEYIDVGTAYISAFASCASQTAGYNIAIAGTR
jgi:hypothetical protein